VETDDKFKVGDEVAVHFGYNSVRLDRVARLTKTQIVLTDGSRFNARTGREVGDGSFYRAHLARPTDDDREKVARRRLMDAFNNIEPRKLSLKQLEAIVEIAKKGAAA
jgi:hypothetical protein